MSSIKQSLKTALGQNLQENIILAPFTTFKIGGPADYFFEAKTKEELVTGINAAKNLNLDFFLLGTGANILVSDKGFRGLVIRNKADKIHFGPENTVSAESGTIFGNLIEQCVARGLSGIEHFIGIPSSVGGALWQNLHFLSPNRTRTIFIEEILKNAEILTEDGKIKTVPKSYFNFDYDESTLHHKKDVVLEATLKLTPADEKEMRKIMAENLKWRAERHPTLDKLPSAGSIFKNIPGHGAGRLIDQCGLKGKQIGNAQIYEKHANMFVNLGEAKAADVLGLIKLTQKEVKNKFNLELEPEISLVGDFD
jgi:UDP-N-acetylmuramate dehydrogenase